MSRGGIAPLQVVRLPRIHNTLCLICHWKEMEKQTSSLGFKCRGVMIIKHFCPCFSALSPEYPFQFSLVFFPLFLYSCLPKFLFICVPLCSCSAILPLIHCPSTPVLQCLSTSQEEHRELRSTSHSYFSLFWPELLQLQCSQGDENVC